MDIKRNVKTPHATYSVLNEKHDLDEGDLEKAKELFRQLTDNCKPGGKLDDQEVIETIINSDLSYYAAVMTAFRVGLVAGSCL